MAYPVGGIASKLGNRYEARWVVEKYIDLLRDKWVSVRLESTSSEEHGVDVFVEQKDGEGVFFQCKGRHGDDSTWSVAKLSSVGIIRNACLLFKSYPNTRFCIVAPLCFTVYQDLVDRVRRGLLVFTTEGDHQNNISEKDKSFFAELSKALEETGTGVSLMDFICRFDVYQYADNPDSAERLNNTLSDILYCSRDDNGVNLFPVLREIAENNMGRPVLAQEFVGLLAERGIEPRALGKITETISCAESLQHEFLDSVTLIGGRCFPRSQTRSVIDALKAGKNVILLGERGTGKSVVLYETLNLLKREPGNCVIPVRLDWHLPQRTTLHFGKDLGLSESPVRCLAAIPGKERLAVLIFDQVDALRWTSESGEAALGICRGIVREILSGFESSSKVQIVLSVRKVDFENDPTLRGLLSADVGKTFTQIIVPPLTEPDLRGIVENISPNSFEKLTFGQRNMLSYPMLLFMWTGLIEEGQTLEFESGRDLCKRFMDKCVKSVSHSGFSRSDGETLLNNIVAHMEQYNRLWAPADLGSDDLLEAFRSAGLLKVVKNKVLFVHQSFVDYRIVLHFLKSGQELTDWALSSRQDFLFREQLKLALLYLQDDGFDNFLRQCQAFVQCGEIRFHLKHLLFVVIAGMEPVDALFRLVSGWLDDSSLSKEAYQTIVFGRISWVKVLDTSGRLEKLIKATTESEQHLGLSLLQSVSHETPDLVKKYWTRITKPSDRYRILPWSATVRLDCFVDLRIDLLGEEGCPQFFYWVEMMNTYPSETAKILNTVISKTSTPFPGLGGVHLSWELPEKYRNNINMEFYWDSEQITLQANQSSIFLESLLPGIERCTSISRLKCSLNDFEDLWWLPALENRDDLIAFIFYLLVFLGKKVAKTRPERLYEILEKYQATDSPIVDLIVAECFLELPDQYADEILSWLLVRSGGFLILDWREHGVSRWETARKAIKRFSISCSDEIFRRLEGVIVGAKDSRQIDSYKRHPRFGICPWGSVQEFLLPCLDEKRTSDYVKGLVGVLSRRPGRYRSSGCGPEIIGGRVQSPIHGKTLSPERWHKTVLRAGKIKKERDRLGRQGGDDIVLRSDVDSFSSDLTTQVLRDPDSFVSFAIGTNMSDLVDTRYLESISDGTTFSNYGGACSKIKTDFQLCVGFWNKYFTQLKDGQGVKNFCSMMQNRGDEVWPMDFYNWLFELVVIPERESFYLKDMSFSSAVLNTTQASAIAAISQAIWAHTELVTSFLPRIRNSFFTIGNPIALCGVVDYLCLAVWKHDQQLAVDLFFCCVEKEERCVTGNNVVGFMNCTIQNKYKEYKPLFKRLLRSSNPHVRRFAVREITARYIILGFFKEEFGVLLASDILSDKENISCVLGKLAGEEEYFEKCVKYLFVFQNDREQSVRTNASGWISRKTLTFSCAPALFNQWMETSNFVNKGLQHTLENFESRLSPFAKGILAMVRTSQYAGSVDQYCFHLLPRVLVRLYEEVLAAADEEGRKLCLDALDNMFRTNMFEVREAVDKLVESDVRNKGC